MKISGVLETCLYARDLDKAKSFYSKLPGIEFHSEEEDRQIFFKCGDGMLLIFNPDKTSTKQSYVNNSEIPLHGTRGEGHIAFSIKEDNLEEWEQFLSDQKIRIESKVMWPNRSVSLYFRDPAGNSLELVSPKLWK